MTSRIVAVDCKVLCQCTVRLYLTDPGEDLAVAAAALLHDHPPRLSECADGMPTYQLCSVVGSRPLTTTANERPVKAPRVGRVISKTEAAYVPDHHHCTVPNCDTYYILGTVCPKCDNLQRRRPAKTVRP
jgi:hypothetical protein